MPRFAYSPSRVAVLAAAMLASAAVPLAAAPLDLTAVPADAKWLMHVDMDAARDSVVVQRAGERMLKMHPHAGRVRPGSIVVARATAVDPDTKCPVLKQGKGFRVAMGEHDGKSFYRARLEMASPAAADDVVDVVKGFTALASLRWGGEADAMKLVDAAKTSSKARPARSPGTPTRRMCGRSWSGPLTRGRSGTAAGAALAAAPPAARTAARAAPRVSVR